MKNKVLIIDNDPVISSILYRVIKSNGLEADLFSTGEDALQVSLSNQYDLILLEINLPGMDGFEIIKTLRKKGISTPIIIVSERSDDFDTLYGLDLGADDYVTKPFSPIILGAKIRALLRRTQNPNTNAESTITVGPFLYNTTTLRFYKNGQEIYLSSKEHALMKLFIDNVDRVFSKEMIYDLIWGDAIVDDNAVMVYIRRLRQKIEDVPSRPRYIKTIRGLGYRFTLY